MPTIKTKKKKIRITKGLVKRAIVDRKAANEFLKALGYRLEK